MDEEGLTPAPYAPADSVLKVLHHIRDKQAPTRLDQRSLSMMGIPDGNVGRVLLAMRFLQLIDEEGLPTPTLRRLERSGTEYAGLLAEVLRAAYSVVFEYVNPATATDTELFRAFGS